MDEEELQRSLRALDVTGSQQGRSDEYIKLLNDLASLQLSKGKVQEAQQLFQQVAALRLPQLAVQVPGAVQESSEQMSDDGLKVSTGNGGHAGTTGGPASRQGSTRIPGGGQEAEDQEDWETQSFGSPVMPRALLTAQPTAAASQAGTGLGSQGGTAYDREWAAAAAGPAPAVSSRDQWSAQCAANTHENDSPQAPGTVWEGGFDHCVEVADLDASVKTSHLQDLLDVVLPDVKLQPFIRWVDDTRAVFVCGNTSDAQQLLDCTGEVQYTLRPFSEAAQASKLLPIAELLPPKPRPKTTAAVAKKLLSHALGIPGLRDRTAEQKLAQARRDAKQSRVQSKEAAASAWGDDE